MPQIITEDSTLSCMECGMQMGLLTPSHLRHKHDMSLNEYQEKHPTAPTITRASYDAKAAKISAAKVGKAPHNKGKPASDTQKAKQSATMRNKFASGEIIHWNTGNVTPTEVKNAISSTLTGKNIDPDVMKEVNMRRAATVHAKVANGWVSPLSGRALSEEHAEKSRRTIRAANSARSAALWDDVESKCIAYNLTINSKLDNGYVSLTCGECDTSFTFHRQIFRNSKTIGGAICPTCYPRLTGTSMGETEVADFIVSLGVDIIRNDRSVLGFGQEIDVLIPSMMLAIEYDGLYWHSEEVHGNPKNISGKTKKLEALGYRVIHIFEDEWVSRPEVVKSRLQHILTKSPGRTIYARKLGVKPISMATKDVFLSEFHIQGTDVAGIRYGAFLGDELIAVMTFKPTNFTKGGDGSAMELSRFAVKSGIHSPGIASKFVRRFWNDHGSGVSTLTSYSDRRWSTGGVYRAMGFTYSHTSRPNYWYFKPNVLYRLHRSNFMKHMLVDDGADPSKTEFEIMDERGYYKIFDAGNDLWVMDNPNKT